MLGISRSEVASNIFIKACNEFIFLESVATSPVKQQPTRDADVREDIKELAELVPTILGDQADYQITVDTDLGDSTLKDQLGDGPNILQVTTNMGDIDLQFQE